MIRPEALRVQYEFLSVLEIEDKEQRLEAAKVWWESHVARVGNVFTTSEHALGYLHGKAKHLEYVRKQLYHSVAEALMQGHMGIEESGEGDFGSRRDSVELWIIK